MLALMDQTREPFVADDAEAMIARKAADRLADVAKAQQDIQIVVEGSKVIVPLPARAVQIIHDILTIMANRTPVSIIPHDADLTTQQAADYLNVSRPYLCKLVDSGQIAATTVGRHRRIRFGDLLVYERKSAEARKLAIAKLAEEAARLNLE